LLSNTNLNLVLSILINRIYCIITISCPIRRKTHLNILIKLYIHYSLTTMLIVVEISLRYQCFVRTSSAKQIKIFAIKLQKLTSHHIQKEKILQIRQKYTHTYIPTYRHKPLHIYLQCCCMPILTDCLLVNKRL